MGCGGAIEGELVSCDHLRFPLEHSLVHQLINQLLPRLFRREARPLLDQSPHETQKRPSRRLAGRPQSVSN